MFNETQTRELILTIIARIFLLALLCVSFPIGSNAQAGRSGQVQGESQKTQRPELPQQKPEPPAPEDQKEVETLKIETDLVTVPVIATDRNGLYIPDLLKNDFSISEDGVPQEIAFFATISVPFHVVLMLDTSASTQEKLGLIRHAADAFVEQLQSRDRVKVISFDDQIHDLNDFTNDRGAIKAAIYRTRSGQGTKLYDAFALALSSLRRIQGRKAIVLFTDGVDYHSDLASFDGTLRGLDEEGVLVYPIRYNTREDTERIARQQSDQVPQLATIAVIRTPPAGTTVPTFPSDDPSPIPTSGTRNKTGPFGLPLPDEIMRRRREERERDRDRDRDSLPPDRLPPTAGRRPGGTDTPDSWPDRRHEPDARPGSTSRRGQDSIGMVLDHLYLTADSYLKALADKSGGRLLRADTLRSLPDAFANIAAELRTQYSIGYYPTNKSRDEGYRKIKVNSTRKNVAIRARPGYRAPSGD
ncbi:MAG: VWA domain-containing protein [Pyrinomonadaceae bacterium]|nr:VWA domain-containing protein [Pyrinomonadaceae bacterium]